MGKSTKVLVFLMIMLFMFAFALQASGETVSDFYNTPVIDWATPSDVSTLNETTTSNSVQDASGNTYTAFVNSAATTDVYVQMTNTGGVKQWGTNGARVMSISGVTFADVRTAISGTTIYVAAKATAGATVYLQKVVGGSPQWGTSPTYLDGIAIATGATATLAGEIVLRYDGGGLLLAVIDNATNNDRIMIGRYRADTGAAIYAMKASTIAGTGAITLSSLNAISDGAGNTALVVHNSHDVLAATNTYGSIFGSIVDISGNEPTAVSIKAGTAASGAGYLPNTNMKVVSDGANGVVVLHQFGSTSPALRAVRFKSDATPVNDTELIATAGSNAIVDAAFLESGTIDYVGLIYNAGADNLTFNKFKIGTATPFAAVYPTAASIDGNEALTSAKLAVLGSTQFMVVAPEVLTLPIATGAADIGAYYLLEGALGISATVRWDNAVVANAGNILLQQAMVCGGNVVALYNDVATSARLVKLHNEARYNLNFSLAIAAVTPIPFQLDIGTGGTISVKDRIENDGDLASPATTVNYYLANNTLFSTATKTLLLGSRNVLALNAGASETADVTTSLIIPPNNSVGGGALNIIAVVNQASYVSEDPILNGNTEADNTSNVAITINAPDMVHFTITKTFPAGNVNPGDNITISDTIQNTGNSAAGSFVINYYLTADTNYDTTNLVANGISLGSRTVSSLAAGGTNTASTNLTLPTEWTIVGIALRLYSFLDSGGAVIEASELNNVLATVNTGYIPLIVNLPNLDGCDAGVCPGSTTCALNITAGTYKAGDIVNYTYVVSNNGGNTTVSNLLVKFYFGVASLTDIPTIKAQCVEVGSVTITSIASGSTYTGASSFVVPAMVGNRLYMVMDPDDAIQEATETDNIVNANVPILGVPELVLSDLWTNIANPDPGDLINIGWIVQNQGGALSPATAIHYYLSTDAILDVTTDTHLGSGGVPTILAGLTDTGTTLNVRIPSTTPAGDYYLIGKVTPVPSEISTANNVLAISLPVGIEPPVADIEATYVPGTLTLNVSLDPGDYSGHPADLFLVARTTLGGTTVDFSYDFATDTWSPGISPALPVGIPLASSTDTVITPVTLPSGTYTFYFGIDLTPNGAVDLGTAYYDSDVVTP